MGYQQYIKQSNGEFNESDVALARELSQGVKYGFRWNGISKQMLSQSSRISDEKLYLTFNTTQEEFWFKIKNFKPYEQTWQLFSKAIMEYNRYMGYE